MKKVTKTKMGGQSCKGDFSIDCLSAHIALLGAILMSLGVCGKNKERIKRYVNQLVIDNRTDERKKKL